MAGDSLLASCWAALERTRDPELDVSLVGLGLVRDVAVEGSTAKVQLTFTSMGCPWTAWIEDGVRSELLSVPGVDEVDIEVVWDRAWSRRDLRADARRQLERLGIAT